MSETTRSIAASELIIHPDGSLFHLHLMPEQVADKVILVGDQNRVDLVARHLTQIECNVQNREFHTVTGCFRGKRVSCVSTGIGCDNIDIVLNELDALKNLDLATRRPKERLTSLEIVRLGTSGGLQKEAPVGSHVATVASIGLDGLLNFYRDGDKVSDAGLQEAFLRHMGWTGHTCASQLYAVRQDRELTSRIAGLDMVQGITVSAGGFYGPQCRMLRIPLKDPDQNLKAESFRWDGLKVMNYEMESSALGGLGALMGHRCATVCLVLANRVMKEASPRTEGGIETLIGKVLERI